MGCCRKWGSLFAGIGKRIICFSFLIVLITVFISPLSVRAEDGSLADPEDKIIRVGYYENEVFEEGAAVGAVKTGYAYEYYRKLSEYTGWKYEYVYGSFQELYDMLVKGEIDLMAGLAWKEERASIIAYPDEPMGNETYTLVKHDRDGTVSRNPKTLRGKKIGVLRSAMVDELEKYLVASGTTAKVVIFEDYDSLFTAFDTKEIDILAAEGYGTREREHAEVISNFGANDYYLCVNIKRKDILDELNYAQLQLSVEEPSYLSTLRSKYYASTISSRSFSESERTWMSEHSSLTIGYLENYLPYSDTDEEGNVTGVIKDLIPTILESLDISGIDVGYVGYRSYDDMIYDVTRGDIDVAFPVGGGLYYSEENGIYQSNAVISTSSDLVYLGEYNDDVVTHFAVNENNKMQYYYIETNFPGAEVSLYPSIEECLDAVLAGEANATTLNGLRANDILRNRKYSGLSLKQLSMADDRCFGVKIGNEGLLKLLNRGVNIIGPEYARNMAYRYAGLLYSYSNMDMFKDNVWLFLSVILVIAVIVILIRLLRTRVQLFRMI
ncbi:transporter substrate-binding domain-containing protein [Butyrivibrio sp. MB2005]|uniref:transporter substrate-binding domain-containing protein n=1 Tax=Butyrivibrio sp. MB2005 TaxID=1280678 RepID=UPI00042A18BA|nr:transporter substrate-binding domain-containing protein [Butyrivibrio sp. MB2005]